MYILIMTALILIVWALMTWPGADARRTNVRSGPEHARSIVGSWRSTSVRIDAGRVHVTDGPTPAEGDGVR